jgi:hypothetical protein
MLRQYCLQGLLHEALAFLDQHGQGLLEQDGPENLVVLNPDPKKIHKVVYPLDRALHAAALGGNSDLVKEFLKRGADIHARGCDPLVCAAYLGQLEVAKTLFHHGANIFAQDLPISKNTSVSTSVPCYGCLFIETWPQISILLYKRRNLPR